MTMTSEPGASPNRRPLLLLFLLLCVLFVVSYTGRMGQLVALRGELAVKEDQLGQAVARQAALEKGQAYAQTEQFTDQVMREQFGMSQPGDALIVAIGPVEGVAELAPADADATQSASGVPVWRQWWQLFAQHGA